MLCFLFFYNFNFCIYYKCNHGTQCVHVLEREKKEKKSISMDKNIPISMTCLKSCLILSPIPLVILITSSPFSLPTYYSISMLTTPIPLTLLLCTLYSSILSISATYQLALPGSRFIYLLVFSLSFFHFTCFKCYASVMRIMFRPYRSEELRTKLFFFCAIFLDYIFHFHLSLVSCTCRPAAGELLPSPLHMCSGP